MAQNRFQMIVENSMDISTILDAQGRVEYQSPSLTRTLGYEPEELIGKNVFGYVHPDDVPTVAPLFERLVQQPWKSQIVEFRMKHKLGAWVHLESIGQSVIDQGKLICVINSRDITERVRIEQQLIELSLADDLTRLHNRRAFGLLTEKEISKMKRESSGDMLILFADVDDLKKINDSQGHAIGDHALQVFAGIFKNTFREVDSIARIGGDEFVACLYQAKLNCEGGLYERLTKNINEWNGYSKESFKLKFSLGFARYGAEFDTVSKLLAAADADMYQDKQKKRMPS